MCSAVTPLLPQKIGPAHVADEQGVAGENHLGLIGDPRVRDQDRHALGGVARSFEELEA
jgi:hypothetical protein